MTDGRRDGVNEAFRGVGREVEYQLRLRSYGASDLDVESHLAVVGCGIAGRPVRGAVHRHVDDPRRFNAQAREVLLQLPSAVTPAEFKQANALAAAASGCREVVELGHLNGRAAARRGRQGPATGIAVPDPDVGHDLASGVEAEDALNGRSQPGRYPDPSRPSAEDMVDSPVAAQFDAEGCLHGSDGAG